MIANGDQIFGFLKKSLAMVIDQQPEIEKHDQN